MVAENIGMRKKNFSSIYALEHAVIDFMPTMGCETRPLKNAPFCPIPASGSNFARSGALALSSKYSMYSCG